MDGLEWAACPLLFPPEFPLPPLAPPKRATGEGAALVKNSAPTAALIWPI